MNASEQTLFERLLEITARFRRVDPLGKYADDEPPLRSELFSADQMERHGKSLAVAHKVASGRARDRLLARLAENERMLALAQDMGFTIGERTDDGTRPLRLLLQPA